MATFVYSPAIRVRVRSQKSGIIDISDDITQWEVIRRSNAVSTFNFTLQNAQRKYDGVFIPGDVISVELKRISWVRVFTGTLNNVPIFSAWPRALPMSASCTLKKLQFWPWDPTTQSAIDMVSKYTNSISTNTTKGDGGLSALIEDALTSVTGWEKNRIHIGAVPNAWFKWAQKTEQGISIASSMAEILGPATIGGTGSAEGGVIPVSGLALPAGKYGNQQLDKTQASGAALVYSIAVANSKQTTAALQDRVALLCLMTAAVESPRYRIWDPKEPPQDHDSLGLYQQRAAWGSAEERCDPVKSTLMFLNGGKSGQQGVFDKSNWKTGDPGSVCQAVQVSGFPDRYNEWRAAAEAIIAKLRPQITKKVTDGLTGSTVSPGGANGGIPTGSASAASGDQIAKVAYDLVSSRPKGTIWYSQERGTKASDPKNDSPTRLDCSSLVEWVYYHVKGSVWGGGNTTGQYASMKVKDIPFDIAKYIRGCIMTGPDHTGIALGDGKNHVAAHQVTPGHKEDCNVSPLPSGLDHGGLAPGIDYTAAATNEAARKYLESKLGKKCTISTVKLGDIVDPSVSGSASGDAAAGGTNPFAQLVSALTSAPVSGGNIFGGPRLLMNNQPFLPWIQNLTNSSMRAFCSAPNGDFMAWFPDYFNVWETAAIMKIRTIELQDFTVEWSDQQIVTHEFVIGTVSPLLDGLSGQIQPGSGGLDQQSAMLRTEGIATMDFPQIFETIYGKSLSKGFVDRYLRRFGARPNMEQFPNIQMGHQEFYMALWRFMKHWSEQFNANVPMTFMPELYPGMILQIDEYKFQAYVSQVTHRGSYGSQGGFTTEARIIAPASTDKNIRSSLFGILDNI